MTTETIKMTMADIMKDIGMETKLSTEDVIAMVVLKKQQKLQSEKDVVCNKIEEINNIIDDSAFNKKVQLVIDKFIEDNNLPNTRLRSYCSDYKDDKAELTLSLTFELPTDGLDDILRIRKEKQPELKDLNYQLRVLNEKINNIKAMERETRAQLAELKLKAMGQDILIEQLVTPKLT